MTQNQGFYRQGIALIIGVLLFVLVLYTLEKTGVPRSYAIVLTGVCALALFGVGVFPAGTTRAEQFLFSSRTSPARVSALATSGLVAFPLLILTGGELYFQQPGFLVVIGIAIISGIALSSLLVARQFNATHASDIAEMLTARYDSTLPARLFAATNTVPGLMLAACGLAASVYLVAWFFALSSFTAFVVVSLCCFLNAALGGTATITRFAAMAVLLLLLGLNLPLLVHTLSENGFPIGHLTFGYSALEPAWELEQQLSSLGIPVLASQISEGSGILSWGAGTQILCAIILMIGTACLPSLVHNTATGPSHEAASLSMRRAILWAGFMVASLVALMAYTQIGFYQSMLGLTLSGARVEAPVLYSWSGREEELIRFCGTIVENAQNLLAACENGADHIVNVPDFELQSRLLLAAAPDLANLPFAFTALLVVSLVGVLISFTSATLLAASNNLVSAFYATLPGKVATGQVFMTRVMVLMLIAATGWLVIFAISDFGDAFFMAISLMVATSVPPILGVFHYKSSTSTGIWSAILVGFLFSVLYYILADYGIDFTEATGDELAFRFPGMGQPVPGELGGLIALPLALIVLVTVSAVTQSVPEDVAETGERETKEPETKEPETKEPETGEREIGERETA